METFSSSQFAALYGLSDRTVRNYCRQGKIAGAFLTGKTWYIPISALPPEKKRKKLSPLLKALKEQKDGKIKGGIYHRVQIDLTYNSNHIEGSKLTKDQTRMIFETHTVMPQEGTAVKVDDIIETVNHFRCVDFIIDHAFAPLSEGIIKQLHKILKSGTADSTKNWFAVGDYKRLPNEVGGIETTAPEDVPAARRDKRCGHHHRQGCPELLRRDLCVLESRARNLHGACGRCLRPYNAQERFSLGVARIIV